MVRVGRWVVLAGLAAILTGGCDSAPTAPTHYAPFGQVDLRLGGGAEAVAGQFVTVHYTGWYYDASKTEQKGVQFETSTGGTPLTFTLGAGQVIAGWDQGLVGMKAGGLRRLIVPPSLAYGPSRFGVIPANATLLFDVELLTVGVAPVVTTEPVDVTVTAGEDASFTAAAYGQPLPTVQWQVSVDGGTTWTDIPGATSATYSFTTVAADNGKRFRAVFTNDVGTATTTPVRLTVQVGGGA